LIVRQREELIPMAKQKDKRKDKKDKSQKKKKSPDKPA
jgi:hypothetical protein